MVQNMNSVVVPITRNDEQKICICAIVAFGPQIQRALLLSIQPTFCHGQISSSSSSSRTKVFMKLSRTSPTMSFAMWQEALTSF